MGKSFTEKANSKPEIRNYEIFKAEILTPENYVEICEGYDDVNGREDWDEMEYLSGDHPSYTRVYKTLRRTCAEQQEIIEAERNLTLVSLALQQLSNLKELILVFCETLEDEVWVKDYQKLQDMTMQGKSYESHIQLVLSALRDRSGPVHKIQLTHLSLPDDTPWQSPDWRFLTILLTELLKHAPSLRLLGSDSVLALLSHASLNIRELELCSIYAELVFLENFLQSNANSLHSLSAHNVKVIERNHEESIDLTPAHIRNTIDIPIRRVKRLDKFSCLCSFQEGWKLFLDHEGSVSALRADKRKWSAS